MNFSPLRVQKLPAFSSYALASRPRLRVDPLFLLIVLFLLLLAPVLPAQADEKVNQSITDFLYEQAQTLGDQVSIEIFETRARFPDCARPQPFLPRNAPSPLLGRLSVGVRCGDSSGSVRYVPVQISVIGTYIEVASAVPAGRMVEASMLTRRQGDLSELPPQAILDMQQAIGQLANRRLSPGTVLQEQHLRQVPLVERGQKVTVESRGRGFVVSREGEAMEAGGLGELIRVRLSRRESLQAVVSGQGRVRTGF